MLPLINSYSFIVLGLLVILIVALLTWRVLSPKWVVGAVTVTFIALVSFQLMGSTKVDTVASPQDFDSALVAGKPVLLELYSNFWIACLRAKPDVDRLERELKDYFLVIRLDVGSSLGKTIRQKYQGGMVPTFIVFDERGNEVWRHSGSVPELDEILLLDLGKKDT